MLAEVVNLWDTDTVAEYLVDLLLVVQLRLTKRNGLLLCNSVSFVPLSRLDQILNLHSEHEIFNGSWLLVSCAIHLIFLDCFPLENNVDTGPDLSESSRAQFFLAQVLASDVLLCVVFLLRCRISQPLVRALGSVLERAVVGLSHLIVRELVVKGLVPVPQLVVRLRVAGLQRGQDSLRLL